MLGEPTRTVVRKQIHPGIRTPSWYGSEEEASNSSFAAAVALGARRSR